MRGTPRLLKARHLKTTADPVINVKAKQTPLPSRHQIMSLLMLGTQNALHVDNATG
jgi:hypothetical protein